MSSNLGIQNRVGAKRAMLCPCCGQEIVLGAPECRCGARFVGEPLDDTPIKVKRFGPVMTAVLMLAIAVSVPLIITKWLGIILIIPIWRAARAMRLARRDSELYGGYKVATATLILAIAAGVFSVVYVAKNIPQFLENRKERRVAATQAAMYHLAGLLEEYKRTYGSYPRNSQEIMKAVTESLPMDYWKKSIRYQSFTEAIAGDWLARTGIPFNNFELRSAGPDGKEGTDDDIIMRDGIFFTNAEIKNQPAIRNSSDR
ncbi:MAG TPA: type II secretion system protein GspG [Blastocatellia bacterium]|nr:type II secretion system protein GspG [Blastocatellia bacterium]